MTNKELFIQTYNKNIHRPGAERLLAWMESTDFFTAPASTRFHAAYEGGLLDHSLNVYNVLIAKHYDPAADDLESFTIVSPVSYTHLRRALRRMRPRRPRSHPRCTGTCVARLTCLLYTSRCV